MNQPTASAPAPAPATPTTAAPSTPPPMVEPHTKAGISPSEAQTMVGWIKQDLASGKLTQAQADQQFAELNTPAEQRLPDTRTDEQKMLDQQFPVAKESDYILRYYPIGQEPPVIPKEVNQFLATARGWLHEMGVTRELGNAVAQLVWREDQHLAALTPSQREARKDAETKKLHDLYGGLEKFEAAMQPVRQMLIEVDRKRPGLLKAVGAWSDRGLLVAQLAQAARLYHARKGR